MSKIKKVKKVMKVRKVKRRKQTEEEKFSDGLHDFGHLFEKTGDYAYIPFKLEKFCVPMSKISLLEKNPRINDPASEKLAILIKENGFRKPVVIDQHGKIRAGNTAYKAARLLNMKFIPAAESDFAGEADAMRYVLSDNKASEFSYWDKDMLKELIESESLNSDEHVAGLGLTDGDLQKLFEIKEDVEKKNLLQVIISVKDEDEAEDLVSEFNDRGFVCRVIKT